MTAKQEVVNKKSGEITPLGTEEAILTSAELNNLATDETSLLALLESWGLTGSDLLIGDAYPLADKNDLIDVPLMFVQWKFGTSDQYGTEFVQIKAVRTDTGERMSIFDSGVGICATLHELSDLRYDAGKPAYNGAMVPKGLRRSDYSAKTNDKGEVIRPAGTTFYLS